MFSMSVLNNEWNCVEEFTWTKPCLDRWGYSLGLNFVKLLLFYFCTEENGSSLMKHCCWGKQAYYCSKWKYLSHVMLISKWILFLYSFRWTDILYPFYFFNKLRVSAFAPENHVQYSDPTVWGYAWVRDQGSSMYKTILYFSCTNAYRIHFLNVHF